MSACWMSLYAWENALAQCTPQTTRAEWREIFLQERLLLRAMSIAWANGQVGSIYGCTVYRG
jgi:hypothetical protein